MHTSALSLSDIMHELNSRAQSDRISLGQLVALFKQRGFGALLFLLAFIIFLPTGLIPGLAAVCAIIICLLCAQMLTGRSKLWLPARLKQKSVSTESVIKGTERMGGFVRWCDRHSHPRLQWAIHPLAQKIIAFICLLLALITIPLSFIPGVGSITSAPILALSLGLMMRDGLILLIGMGIFMLAIAASIFWLI